MGFIPAFKGLNFVNVLSCNLEADLRLARGNVCKETGILGVHII